MMVSKIIDEGSSPSGYVLISHGKKGCGIFFIRREIMVKYEYDFDIMIKKIRKTWSPEDFFTSYQKFNDSISRERVDTNGKIYNY